MRWFVPCWSGDFRLEPGPGVEVCILTVVNPSQADLQKLQPFLETARSRGWISPVQGIALTGSSTLLIEAPLLTAGPVLAGKTLTEGERWTAVRCVDGQITLADGTGEDLAAQAAKAEPAKKPEAAATIKAPGRGCPPPTAAALRASEVLAAFSTRKQITRYLQQGSMIVVGSHTGRVYEVFHRGAAAALGIGHCAVDLASGEEICVWDNAVPPQEETLGIKLALEHRELWALQRDEPQPRMLPPQGPRTRNAHPPAHRLMR